MDILERIIESLTSDEVRRFKILSNRFKADEEKKLLILFDAIRAGDYKANEDKVVRQLYTENDAKARNSYYRLRNKLLSNLEKSLLFYHFNYRNTIEALSYVQLALLFKERGLYRESHYQLRKAEKGALENDQFSVLEVIYDEMVKLAPYTEIEIEQIIEKRRENQGKIEILRANSEVLGMVTRQLSRRNYSRNKKTESVIETLQQVRERLEEHAHIFRADAGKIMIMKTAVAILIQKGAWRELADYAEETFQRFDEEGVFEGENFSLRMTLRIYRINALHKLLLLAEAKSEIDALEEDMEVMNRKYFFDFAFNYYNNRVFNLKYSGELAASGQVLQQALEDSPHFPQRSQKLYILISLADQEFCEGKYTQAGETIDQVMSHPAYQELDAELQFYIQVFQLVNLYEAGLYDTVSHSFKRFRKKFRSFFKDEFYTKAVKFLDILIRMNTAAIEGRKVFLKAAYRNFTEEFSPSEIGDNQILLYELYLQSKLEGALSYYDALQRKAQKLQPTTSN